MASSWDVESTARKLSDPRFRALCFSALLIACVGSSLLLIDTPVREWRQLPKRPVPTEKAAFQSDTALKKASNLKKPLVHSAPPPRAAPSPPGRQADWSTGSGKLQLADFVNAIASHSAHLALLTAGRAVRQDIRTFIVVEPDDEHKDGALNTSTGLETWATYPDDEPKRSLYAGDSRLAMAPFLAFQEYGDSFKWVFYGDDDTVFFPDAALAVAEKLDHNLPIFLSDNYWYSHEGGMYHPHRHAPACLPCNHSSSIPRLRELGYDNLAAVCPCTPEALCNHSGLQATWRGCKSGWQWYSHHGGAGSLISVGLLRQVTHANMERCIKRVEAPGGDAFLAECLWLHGIAPTTPDPLWHPLCQQMFSPSSLVLETDDYILFKTRQVLGNMLLQAAGMCQGLCKLEMKHTVSLHLRARAVGGSELGSAVFIRTFARLYARISSRSRPQEPAPDWHTVHPAVVKADQDIELEIEQGVLDLMRIGEAIVAALLQSGPGQEVSERHQEALQLETMAGSVRIMDRMMAEAGDAVAMQILEGIRRKVKPLAAEWGEYLYAVDECSAPEM